MGGEGGGDAADGVGEDGFGGELAVSDRVEHGGVGAEEAAPAHADGGEDRDGIAVYPTLLHEGGDEPQGGADGTQGGDGEGYEVRVLQAKEPVEDKRDFPCEPRQERRTLVGGTRVAVCARAESEHHDQRGDNQHARDDGYTDLHTRFAAVQEGVEDAEEDRRPTPALPTKGGRKISFYRRR